MNQEQQVKEYLDNETKLYQDWFKAVNQLEAKADTQLIAVLPSLPNLKKRFDKWFVENHSRLQQVMCKEGTMGKSFCKRWKAISGKHEYQHLIIGLTTDFAFSQFVHPSHTVVVASILVISQSLDKLCPDCG